MRKLFLDNGFRDAWTFKGTPIRLRFRSGKDDDYRTESDLVINSSPDRLHFFRTTM